MGIDSMKNYRIKLKFKSPLHIGQVDKVETVVSEIIHSDTIFSAIINSYNILYGKEKTKELIEYILENEDSILISSAFYYYENIYFYPKPLGYKFDLVKKFDFKKVKKIKFVSEEYLMGEVKNPIIANNLATDGKTVEKLYSIEERPRITVDRITNETNIFYVSSMRFSEHSGLWFFISLSEKIENEIFAALKLLSDEGLGGDRTYGNGNFDFDVEEVDFGRFRGENYLLLSVFYPKDQGEIDSTLSYKLYERSGYVYSQYSMSYKQPLVRFFSEGSVFKNKVIGDVLDITPVGFEYHKVFKFARAYTIPIKKEAQYDIWSWNFNPTGHK